VTLLGWLIVLYDCLLLFSLTASCSNNMVCIATSDDYIRDPDVMAGGKIVVNPKDRYYRPLYSLPNFDAICNNWQYMNTDSSTIERVGPYPISMLDAAERSWSDLGHQWLDSAKEPKISPAQRELLQTLQVSMTFVGRPAAVGLDRGFWDVPNVRKKLKSVSKTLPAFVRRPFCKTTKMLFVWGIEIRIKLPVAVDDLSSKNVSLGFLKVPLAPVKDSTNELLFTAGCDTYPLLLAVLSSII
jgi:hypothetical protein